MQIKSRIERKTGNTVELDGVTYEFNPPSYIADVTEKAHIARFLSIPEGYEVVTDGKEKSSKPKKADEKQEEKQEEKQVILLGSDVHPSAFEINGIEYSLGDVVQRAFAAAGMNHTAWNELGEGERADLIDAELDKLANPATPPAISEEQVRESLVEQYLAKFGKKPHHKLSNEKIRAELEA